MLGNQCTHRTIAPDSAFIFEIQHSDKYLCSSGWVKLVNVSFSLYIYSFVVRTLHVNSGRFQVCSTSCLHNLLYSYYRTQWQDIPICCNHHVPVLVWKDLLSFIGIYILTSSLHLSPTTAITVRPKFLWVQLLKISHLHEILWYYFLCLAYFT